MKAGVVRRIVLAAAFVSITAGIVLNTGAGTLSSFGWQAIAAICPLGVLEGIVAGGTLFPRALVVLGVTVVLVALFGKAFCSWVCPVAPVRALRRLIGRKRREKNGEKAAPAALAVGATPSDTCKDCGACATRRAKLDSRHLVLGGSLLSAAVFGFPVFCLVCPIGLVFGSVILLWQWLNFDNLSLSLLIYPALLVVELLVLRRWCARFCPLGALLSVLSLGNRFFRPRVDGTRCLRMQGVECQVCYESCPEGLDPHCSDGMNECSKCGLCRDNCPAHAIRIPLSSKASAEASSKAPPSQVC
ncbi:MAG: 4Fe-4S binding protein [Coriobacteriales bacterium]|jgi:ferredoxin-type protein NapH|nr:4Fe-4S binding protein [Coriobacteriales bacterium]